MVDALRLSARELVLQARSDDDVIAQVSCYSITSPTRIVGQPRTFTYRRPIWDPPRASDRFRLEIEHGRTTIARVYDTTLVIRDPSAMSFDSLVVVRVSFAGNVLFVGELHERDVSAVTHRS